jgi:hypothetical protein
VPHIAVARIIDDDIETPKRLHRHMHSAIGRSLICHVEGSGANSIAMLLYEVIEAPRIAGGCDELIARCEHCAAVRRLRACPLTHTDNMHMHLL